jgi:hypothetical protein
MNENEIKVDLEKIIGQKVVLLEGQSAYLDRLREENKRLREEIERIQADLKYLKMLQPDADIPSKEAANGPR